MRETNFYDNSTSAVKQSKTSLVMPLGAGDSTCGDSIVMACLSTRCGLHPFDMSNCPLFKQSRIMASADLGLASISKLCVCKK